MSTLLTDESFVTRLEIVSYDKIVFEALFADFAKAEAFHRWWANQPTLPQGGATLMRADKINGWRAAHPLERAELTREQKQIIADYPDWYEVVEPNTQVAEPFRSILNDFASIDNSQQQHLANLREINRLLGVK